MASEVDICNLALSHLGDEATVSSISPPDGSQQADYCARFYPIARDQLLALHAWSAATKRVALAEISTTELPPEWEFCYASPPGAIQVIGLRPPGVSFDDANDEYPFVQEVLQDGSKVIYTNVNEASARYVHGVTDTAKFSALFVTALARLLASYLAGPIIKGKTGMQVAQAHYQAFARVDLPLAVSADQKGQRVNLYRDFIPDGLRARG